MEADSWSRLVSGSSKRHQLSPQSRYDLYVGAEEVDSLEEDSRVEFACPFCAEDFDIVGLCCHIDDEHPQETKSGICPICASRVGMDLVGHLTMEHGSFFKISFLIFFGQVVPVVRPSMQCEHNFGIEAPIIGAAMLHHVGVASRVAHRRCFLQRCYFDRRCTCASK